MGISRGGETLARGVGEGVEDEADMDVVEVERAIILTRDMMVMRDVGWWMVANV